MFVGIVRDLFKFEFVTNSSLMYGEVWANKSQGEILSNVPLLKKFSNLLNNKSPKYFRQLGTVFAVWL